MEAIFIILLVVVLCVSAIVQLVLEKKVKRITSPFIQASMLTVLPIIWARGIEWQAVQVGFFNQSFLYSISAFMLGMWGLFLLLMVRENKKETETTLS
ncbi:hypothetical protein [Shouchella lehensis]|uniref:Uncharacterized protein n=1 Tax=Shouchella lehensis G1 TaxID=1246626 RepID=A0A060LZ19_9BACI|nr:hypothetical protein [Shouchella lehensis]AIC93044.1 hypothetical protein BleG1_0436 [Shouchella lehensis G1]